MAYLLGSDHSSFSTHSKMSRDIFNNNVLDRYNCVDEVKTRYYLKDPSLMKADDSYPVHSPIAICQFPQEKYNKLFKHGHWHALLLVCNHR